MTGPSEAQIAEWVRLADEATEGPWHAYHPDQCCGGYCVDNDHGLPLHSGGDLLPNDAAFIAAAREAVPALLAEVARLRAQVAGASEGEALAKAWDEGHRQGCDLVETLCRRVGDLDANPYRAAENCSGASEGDSGGEVALGATDAAKGPQIGSEGER